MNRKRFLLLAAILSKLISHSNAYTEDLGSAPIVVQGPLRTVAASSTAARRSTPLFMVMRAGIGVLDPRANPVNLANLGEEFFNLHLAAAAMVTTDLLSTSHLSLALDGEVWMTFGSYREAYLETVPILLGARASLFPSCPVRLYGTGGAGLCISKLSWSGWVDSPQWPFFPIYESNEESDCAFAYAVGGGIEAVRGRRLFSIDYRYLAAGSDAKLGGHLLCLSVGFLLR